MAVDSARSAMPALAAPTTEIGIRRPPQTFSSMALQSLRRDKLTLVAIGVILLLGVLALAAAPLTAALVGVGPNVTNT
ncbi:MAG: hypothetical protein M3Q45_11340, partial [Chloroflexota bacterium]|nr:hypothetical protein [Chloroflexota bacterium]